MVTIHLGECVEVMRTMEANSIDAIVTDPPYGLSDQITGDVMRHMIMEWLGLGQARGAGFMGKKWDACVPGPNVWREVLRVLKPGGHALSFFGTRTYDLGVLAMRLAGFEIRDQLAWMYGSGFPKSLNGPWGGTALKPAQEPIVLARKPLVGTVAANVLAHGTGGINVDGCRIGTSEALVRPQGQPVSCMGGRTEGSGRTEEPAGRWPANVLLDESAAELLDAQSGHSKSTDRPRNNRTTIGDGEKYNGGAAVVTHGHADSGGASRFFYVAKASRAEREAGLDHLPKHTAGEMTDRAEGSDGLKSPRAGAGRTSSGRANNHPTVKPIALMRYLVRLVTPPGGTVLDPFAGSGTTLCAASLEGFDSIGIEMDPEYVEIARARVAHWDTKA